MDITEEQLEKYREIRDNFHQKKRDIEDKIEKHKSALKNLVNKLKMPVLKGCDCSMICEDCEIHSMKYDGQSPGQGEHYNWYKCIICGHTDYST